MSLFGLSLSLGTVNKVNKWCEWWLSCVSGGEGISKSEWKGNCSADKIFFEVRPKIDCYTETSEASTTQYTIFIWSLYRFNCISHTQSQISRVYWIARCHDTRRTDLDRHLTCASARHGLTGRSHALPVLQPLMLTRIMSPARVARLPNIRINYDFLALLVSISLWRSAETIESTETILTFVVVLWRVHCHLLNFIRTKIKMKEWNTSLMFTHWC